MDQNPDLQNTSQFNNNYKIRRSQKIFSKKTVIIVLGLIIFFALINLAINLKSNNQQSKYAKSATAAARKTISNANATSVKVAGGFAVANVNYPNALRPRGYATIFKVNKDGSMVELAISNSFGPIDLLGFGIPFQTQAELTGSTLAQVQQNLANQCGYNNGNTGFYGFNGSFNPGQWQIDATTLSGIEEKLTSVVKNQNNNINSNKSVICVTTSQQNSNFTIDNKTYISTFTLQLQFISKDGTSTKHTFNFSIGPERYSNYTFDGIAI